MKPIEKEPSASFVLEVTPEYLRTLADRIEAKQKQAQEGQRITVPITDKIMLLTPTVHHNGK